MSRCVDERMNGRVGELSCGRADGQKDGRACELAGR